MASVAAHHCALFNVASVSPDTPMYKTHGNPISSLDSILQTVFGKVEAHSPFPKDLVAACDAQSRNSFAAAISIAFYKHYPLALSPSAVWLAIAQVRWLLYTSLRI